MATNAITDNSFLGLLIILLLFWQISVLDLDYINVKFYFTNNICWIIGTTNQYFHLNYLDKAKSKKQ